MAWITGNNNIKPTRDVTKDFLALEGELTDEEARATLAEFFYHNPALMMRILADLEILPMQELIIKGWMKNNFNLAVWGRGVSKSFTVALFAMIWAIFNPNNRIVIISTTFRVAKSILVQIGKFIEDKDGKLLKPCFPNEIKNGTDECKLVLPNGAEIRCLPLGDGKKIRSVRADTLIVDEFAYVPEPIIVEVLQPFLVANNDIKERKRLKRREDAKIAAGKMTEEERSVIASNTKVIFLSSASYQFEHLYKRYLLWTGYLLETEQAKIDAFKKTGSSYFISRIGYEAAPPEIIKLDAIEEAKQSTSEAVFNREYRAIFTANSDGFYKMSNLVNCSIPDRESPTLEIIGEKDEKAEYIVGIDVSSSGAENSDHFAICVLKVITRETDKKKILLVVHSYAVAGGTLNDHTLYLYYILKHFNVVYIAVDASQGDNVEFMNFAASSTLFRDNKIELSDLDVDFKKEDFKDIPAEIKRSYNKTIGRIVQKQPFGSAWQRAANEYMQGCFDRKDVLFAAKICPNSEASERMSKYSWIMPMLSTHSDFRDMSIMDFLATQDRLIDMTRHECASIKVDVTDLGNMKFHLPANMRRSSNANRLRKDNYSALLLGVWAGRMYLESQAVVVQTGPQDFPYWGY